MRRRLVLASSALALVSVLALGGCGGSGTSKASHSDVLAAVKVVCAERDKLASSATPDSNLSTSGKAAALNKLTEKYNRAVSKLLSLNADDANDERLLDQLNASAKALKAIDLSNPDAPDQIKSSSAKQNADIVAAGREFSCMNG